MTSDYKHELPELPSLEESTSEIAQEVIGEIEVMNTLENKHREIVDMSMEKIRAFLREKYPDNDPENIIRHHSIENDVKNKADICIRRLRNHMRFGGNVGDIGENFINREEFNRRLIAKTQEGNNE